MKFQIENFHNPYLPPAGARVDLIVTVTGQREAEVVAAMANAERVVGFIIDVSPSMDEGGKIEAAKHAVRKSIAALPPEVFFFVVTFGRRGKVIAELAQASEQAKVSAAYNVRNAESIDSTALSTGLAAAREQFAKMPEAICYGILLTDGRNVGEGLADLSREIERCKGKFQCDCRGVGADWDREELWKISNALLGTADAISKPEDIETDFRLSLDRALSKSVRNVGLQFWTPASTKLVSLRQKQPEDVDLTPLLEHRSARVTHFPIGAWGDETRDYHAVFSVSPQAVGEEVAVCRTSVVWDENGEPKTVKAEAPVMAQWNDDAARTAQINQLVAHYSGQSEMAGYIEEGLAARNRGNWDEATRLLGKAAKIANDSGNADVTRRLTKVVDIVDAAAGTVRMKKNVDRAEELELAVGGTRTVRRNRAV